jgi:16S rRNA (uracil1498-N3)-methyltransferase
LTRVYVEAALTAGGRVDLPPDTAAHLVRVLRARAGDELILFNGDGREFNGAIEAVRGSRVAASVGDGRPMDRESPLSITLVQCIPRGDRMDFIVQKATELGVARIVPVLSQRSVVRLDKSQAESKANHWRAVAVSACEQCGRNRLPGIISPQGYREFLRTAPGGMRVLLSPGGGVTLKDLARPDGAVTVLIGPEGGLTDEEEQAAVAAGFTAVRLGPRVLRTETAAIAALALLQREFGDF